MFGPRLRCIRRDSCSGFDAVLAHQPSAATRAGLLAEELQSAEFHRVPPGTAIPSGKGISPSQKASRGCGSWIEVVALLNPLFGGRWRSGFFFQNQIVVNGLNARDLVHASGFLISCCEFVQVHHALVRYDVDVHWTGVGILREVGLDLRDYRGIVDVAPGAFP